MKTKSAKGSKKHVRLVKGTGKGLGRSERARQMAEYKKSKLAVQKKIRVGAVLQYHGRNAKLQGKRVKVVGLEKTQGGVIIEAGNRTVHISPFALLREKVAAAK